MLKANSGSSTLNLNMKNNMEEFLEEKTGKEGILK